VPFALAASPSASSGDSTSTASSSLIPDRSRSAGISL
jgi:hypothetical protein